MEHSHRHKFIRGLAAFLAVLLAVPCLTTAGRPLHVRAEAPAAGELSSGLTETDAEPADNTVDPPATGETPEPGMPEERAEPAEPEEAGPLALVQEETTELLGDPAPAQNNEQELTGILRNPDFEDITDLGTAWNKDYGFNFNTIGGSDKIYSGDASMRFYGSSSAGTELHLYQHISLVQNDSSVYTISANIIGAGISYVSIAITKRGETDWIGGEVYTPREDWDTWKRINTGRFTAPETGDYTLTVTIDLRADGGGYLDLFSMTETVDTVAIEEARTALRDRIAEIRAMDTGDYTDASVSALRDEITAAEAVADDTAARLAALTQALSDLNAAVDALVPIPAEQLAQARERLNRLIATAESHASHPEYYTAESYDTLFSALSAARRVSADPDAQLAALVSAADTLAGAIDSLATVTAEAPLNVTRIPGIMDADGFLRGFDLSTWQAVRESGARFYDEGGEELGDAAFFRFLKASGVNTVRIKVWNDPYDIHGKGYGAGNCDLEKAIRTGRYATNAGMRVALCLPYSDFTTDTDRQHAPKAWQEVIDLYGSDSAEAVQEISARASAYTRTTLGRLLDTGVNVTMVQIGSMTDHGIAGITGPENTAAVLSACVDTVRDMAEERHLVLMTALNFSCMDNASLLERAEACDPIPYDVFSVSYDPFRDGTTAALKNRLCNIASLYDRQVMVSDTSYVYTWRDGDGWANSAPGTDALTLTYPVSVQGQAMAIHDVVDAVASLTPAETGADHGRGIGVFYTEPAWIPAYYAYRADGTLDTTLYRQNTVLWEEYGSGTAASYASSYDDTLSPDSPSGITTDNRSLFDFYGNPLPSLQIFRYLQTGAAEPEDDTNRQVTRVSVADGVTEAGIIRDGVLTMELGQDPALDRVRAEVLWSNGTADFLPVSWREDEVLILNRRIRTTGTYSINGTVTVGQIIYPLTLTVTVRNPGNQLENGTFETAQDLDASSVPWRLSAGIPPHGTGAEIRTSGVTAYSGTGALYFGDDAPMSLDVSQFVAPAAGTYTLSARLQGNMGEEDAVRLWAQVGDAAPLVCEVGLSGPGIWQNPVIRGIHVEDGQILTVGIHVEGAAGLNGSVDDMQLLGSYPIDTISNKKQGTIAVTAAEASQGETVSVFLRPAAGYRLDRLTLNGAEQTVTGSTFSFSMPEQTVTLEAFWTALPVSIPLEDCDIRLEQTALRYIGKPLEPAVIATYADGAVTLTKGTDYTVTYSNNLNAGNNKAIATVIGKGRFKGRQTLFFTIMVATSLSTATIDRIPDQEYTGYAVCPVPVVSIKTGGVTRVLSEADGDYSVIYDKNISVGTATLTVIGNNEFYSGSRSINFRILQRNIAKHLDVEGDTMTSTLPAAMTYTGAAIVPPLVIRHGARTLEQGKDYRVSCSNNLRVSKNNNDAIVTITGIGNYKGTVKKNFTISPKSVNDSDVKIHVGSVVAGGLSVRYPTVKFEAGGRVLAAGGHYEIFRDPDTTTAPGVKRLKIRGIGNLCDETDWIDYYASAASDQITSMRVTGNGSQTYRCGDRVELPDLTFINRYNVAFSEYYTDPRTGTVTHNFSVEYVNNVNIGTATAKVTGLIPECAGYREITYRIVPIRIPAARIADVDVTLIGDPAFGAVRYATGYPLKPDLLVRYNYVQTDENGNETHCVKILTRDADYRANYAANIRPGTARVTVSGTGAYVFSKQVTFPISQLAANALTWYVLPATYTGRAITPEIRFLYQGKEIDLKNGTAYRITLRNNLAAAPSSLAGSAPYLKLTPLYWNAPARETTFTIKPAPISEADVTVNPVTYTGRAFTPNVRVAVNRINLVSGRDFTAALNIPDNPESLYGLRQMIVTGMGNYCGSVTKTVIVR